MVDDVVTSSELVSAMVEYFREAKKTPEKYMDSNDLDESNYNKVAKKAVNDLFKFVLAQRSK